MCNGSLNKNCHVIDGGCLGCESSKQLQAYSITGGNYLQDYKASQPTKPQSISPPP
jgi:hypothetical protein